MAATIRTPKLVTMLAADVALKTVEFAPEYDPNTTRTVIVNMNASDSIAMRVIGVWQDPTTFAETTVGHTVQTFTGATSFAFTIEGPIQEVTFQKTGTAGGATIMLNG